LGRGLDVLLGAPNLPALDVSAAADRTEGALRQLPLELIQRGRYQPRREFDAESLEELAHSIRAQGVVQPIVVRPAGEGRYELIAGERRWRAAQLAGLGEIPALIRDVPDEAAIAMALIENIQRQDLNAMEEAAAFARLVQEFKMTHQEVAEAVGRSRASVSNLLRLLDLNEEVKRWVEEGTLEMGHARALLGLQGQVQTDAARQVVGKGLSVRETERLVRRLQSDRPVHVREVADANIRKLQEELSERLGTGVQFEHTASGKGRLVIRYGNLEQLEGILAHIR
jgi:ParB family chromosome partitioning protein